MIERLNTLFIQILNMSLTGSIVILAVQVQHRQPVGKYTGLAILVSSFVKSRSKSCQFYTT